MYEALPSPLSNTRLSAEACVASSFKPFHAKMSSNIRFAKGPASDGSRGFVARSRSPSPPAGGGGGGPAAPASAPQMRCVRESGLCASHASLWAAVAEGAIFSSMTKKTLVSNLTTYAEARKKAVEYLLTLPADAKFHACRNRPWLGGSRVRVLTHAQMEEAFPATEEMVEEYFDLSAFKGDKYLGGISLFPQTSYVCSNMSWLLFPKDEEEEESYRWGDDDDRGYESEDNYRSDDEEPWQRNCTCDASGPYWCSCRRDDDDY